MVASVSTDDTDDLDLDLDLILDLDVFSTFELISRKQMRHAMQLKLYSFVITFSLRITINFTLFSGAGLPKGIFYCSWTFRTFFNMLYHSRSILCYCE